VSGRLARQLHAPPHVVAVRVPRRLRLAPHAGRHRPPAEATGRDAGAGRGGKGGGAEGVRGEVRARDERGGHGRREEPNPRGQGQCVRGERVRLGLGRLAAEGGYLSICLREERSRSRTQTPSHRAATRAVPPLHPRRRLLRRAALPAVSSLSSTAAPTLHPQT
jgi:hypothetical protein